MFFFIMKNSISENILIEMFSFDLENATNLSQQVNTNADLKASALFPQEYHQQLLLANSSRAFAIFQK